MGRGNRGKLCPPYRQMTVRKARLNEIPTYLHGDTLLFFLTLVFMVYAIP